MFPKFCFKTSRMLQTWNQGWFDGFECETMSVGRFWRFLSQWQHAEHLGSSSFIWSLHTQTRTVHTGPVPASIMVAPHRQLLKEFTAEVLVGKTHIASWWGSHYSLNLSGRCWFLKKSKTVGAAGSSSEGRNSIQCATEPKILIWKVLNQVPLGVRIWCL